MMAWTPCDTHVHTNIRADVRVDLSVLRRVRPGWISLHVSTCTDMSTDIHNESYRSMLMLRKALGRILPFHFNSSSNNARYRESYFQDATSVYRKKENLGPVF